MTTWFTSDLHFGHERIIELCNRPFRNFTHMNAELLNRWNQVVEETDTVFVLGDLALGKLSDSLQFAAQLLGKKYLVPGNHDRCWSGNKRSRQVDWDRYKDAGFTILPEQFLFRDGLTGDLLTSGLLLCHFPYAGDSQELDRHVDHRPKDEGLWLLHGHTHAGSAYNDALHPRQIHVGVDAWDYRPVLLETILAIIATASEEVRDRGE